MKFLVFRRGFWIKKDRELTTDYENGLNGFGAAQSDKSTHGTVARQKVWMAILKRITLFRGKAISAPSNGLRARGVGRGTLPLRGWAICLLLVFLLPACTAKATGCPNPRRDGRCKRFADCRGLPLPSNGTANGRLPRPRSLAQPANRGLSRSGRSRAGQPSRNRKRRANPDARHFL